jgi:putative flippase GtrA
MAWTFNDKKRKGDLLRLRWNEMAKSGLTLMLIGINLFICLQWMGEIILKPDYY